MNDDRAARITALVIEDEAAMRRLLRTALPAHGYRVLEASSGAEGLAEAAQHKPDLLLLDLGLPDMDGVEVTSRLREWSVAPILIISARGQETDKVLALDAGADDYVTKPFGMEELLARMRVALRHAEKRPGDKTSEAELRSGDLRVDLRVRQVFLKDEEVHLSPLEYKLLAVLVRYAGRVVTRQQLLKEVWGVQYTSQTQYLHVYMGHLRSKLEVDPARPKTLLTEPGIGYRLRVD